MPLTIAGVLTASAFGVGARLAQTFSDSPIQDLDVSPVFVAKLLEVHDVLMDTFLNPMLFQVVVVMLLGLGMVGVGVYRSVSRRRRGAPVEA